MFERVHNLNFNYGEFAIIKNKASVEDLKKYKQI